MFLTDRIFFNHISPTDSGFTTNSAREQFLVSWHKLTSQKLRSEEIKYHLMNDLNESSR